MKTGWIWMAVGLLACGEEAGSLTSADPGFRDGGTADAGARPDATRADAAAQDAARGDAAPGDATRPAPDGAPPPPVDAAPPPPPVDAAPPPPPPEDAAPPPPPDAAPPPLDDAVVGVMYHFWWVPGRWQGDRGNYVYEPSLGHYDSGDPAVIQQHIAWSIAAGVNTWVLDAWITDRDWGWVSGAGTSIMDALDAAGLRYFVLVDGWFEFEGGDDGYASQEIAARVNAKFGPWMERPGYLRVDGKPVVFFWASWGKTCRLFDRIRSGIEGTLGPIYMTGNTGDDGNRCFDRVMEYNSYTNESGAHDDQVARQHRLFRGWRDDGRPWAPTAIPGYDDTHVRAGNPPVPLDPDFFRESLQAALRYDQLAEPRMLYVCSWNEFHEGSNMEPSSDFDEPEVFVRAMREELRAAGWVR